MAEEEATGDNREYCRNCGWCSEEPFSIHCAKWQKEIRQALSDDSTWDSCVGGTKATSLFSRILSKFRKRRQ